MENTSGYYPMLHRVLLKHIPPEITKGVIQLTDDHKSREDMAQVHAIFVAAGPEAFSDKPKSQLPKPGDHVVIAKLAGFFIDGEDGERYRLINDLDLVAVRCIKNA